ncbi:hypothetical protein V6N13_077077 [Hibiscus sabdariffa]
MAHPPQPDVFAEYRLDSDAGAVFVLESKGKWWHAGFHLTTAIVGPTILTLPYAFRGLGWILGFSCLTGMGCVTFYSYYLMSLVLDHCEKDGRRHIRFRELAADVLDHVFEPFPQRILETVCVHSNGNSGDGSSLSDAIIPFPQTPQFCLSHPQLGLHIPCGWCLYPRRTIFGLETTSTSAAGLSKNSPPRDYSLESKSSARTFSAFTSISIIAASFGNGILPEIQATLAPPATGKMFKGLVLCYSVILVTFYTASASGYWAFGNKSNSNILKSLMPDDGPALAPPIVIALAVLFILLQLFAIGLVYSQVAYEIMEQQSADVNQGMFSKRNLIPRLILRTLYNIFCGFMAALLPFFGDINGVIGAIGFIPLDFVLPMLLYNMTYKRSKSPFTYRINLFIMVVFTGVGIMGTFSSIRKLVIDANHFKLFSSDVA